MSTDKASVPVTAQDSLLLPTQGTHQEQHEPDGRPGARHRWWVRHGAGLTILFFDVLAILVVIALPDQWSLGPEIIFGVSFLVLNYGRGLYHGRAQLSALDDFPRLLGNVFIAAAIGLVSSVLLSDPTGWRTAALMGGFVVMMCIERSLSYHLIARLRKRGVFAKRTVIVGTGVVASRLADAIESNKQNGLELIGFIDNASDFTNESLSAPVLGRPEHLNKLIIENDVDHVIIAFTHMRESELVAMIRTADRRSCEISMVERFFEVAARRPGLDEVAGIPIVRLQRGTFRTPAWKLKRLMDIVVSGTALILLSPLMIAVALYSRITEGPGIIFKQERVSLDGQSFEIMKFRSLRPANDAESATKWNVKNDDRMSKFGKFLRKSSIDELPQLFNILNGDMSLVGPRPERPHFVNEFGQEYRHYDHRHRVPSGLTGWAQVNGLRGDTSIQERARYDNYYIENWSLWLDIKIMIRTVFSLTRASG